MLDVGEDLERLVEEFTRAGDVRVPVESELSERSERPAFDLPLARLASGRADGEPAALEGRLELDGAKQQMASTAESLTREGAAAGLLEDGGGAGGEVGRRRPVELGQQRARLVEVERADLEQFVAGSIVEPVGEAQVVLGPRSLRETAVRDLADQHVLEAVGLLAGDRRAGLGDHEVARKPLVDDAVDVLDLRRQPGDRAAPKRPPDHGCALEHGPTLRSEAVDPGSDQRLNGVRNLRRRATPTLGEHANGLLEEQRVALGLVEQDPADAVADRALR